MCYFCMFNCTQLYIAVHGNHSWFVFISDLLEYVDDMFKNKQKHMLFALVQTFSSK